MDIQDIAKNCLGCLNPRCQANCPCGNAIRDILAKVKAGEEIEAAKLLYETNPFPFLTSTLCDHQRQCRGNCIRGIRFEPVDFPAVENELSIRFPFPYKPGPRIGKNVAIIGAGPSALSAAVFLEQAGFDVEIYEKEEGIGGAIRTGIPNFRFDKSYVDGIYQNLLSLGVKFHFGKEIDREGLDQIRTAHDETILALGAEKENRLPTPDSPDIHFALTVLHELNITGRTLGLDKKKNVIVMGGGNVAMDVSRSIKRLGVPVTLIYRRDEASMPAQKKEIAEAKDDGVVFSELTNIKDYRLDEQGNLVALELVKMRLGEKDESGRPSFRVIEGSEFIAPCDAFIMAIGEKSTLPLLIPEEEVTGNLHAIGDCRYGAKNIAAAIKDGREKAQEIIGKYRG